MKKRSVFAPRPTLSRVVLGLLAVLAFACAGCGSGVRNVLGKTVASVAASALNGNDPNDRPVTAVCVDNAKTTSLTPAADCAGHGGVSYFVP